jgi:carbamoyl-phosphate synthase small subunit
MTYPEIGNYGVDQSWAESDPDDDRPIKPAGFVVRNVYDGPVSSGRIQLDRYLDDRGIPGITGIDTRALTLDLRENGSRNACLVRVDSGTELSERDRDAALDVLRAFPAMEGRNLVPTVGERRARDVAGTGPHLAVYDCGAKSNIVRELTSRGCRISIVPSDAGSSEIAAVAADAFLISNGPGDPAVLQQQVAVARDMIGSIPVFGICLGHQIIAEALGASTFKMKFGHHGVNHPVRDERSGRVFVTSQNHGFAVDESTISGATEVWFRNANDGTIEGLRDDDARVATTQFHPESAPGPHDAAWIFDAFLDLIASGGGD